MRPICAFTLSLHPVMSPCVVRVLICTFFRKGLLAYRATVRRSSLKKVRCSEIACTFHELALSRHSHSIERMSIFC